MKNALIIRHVPVEGLAGFRDPIEAAGYRIDRVDVSEHRFASLDFDEPDLVIMMGGPMSVYEHEAHPWIACQKRRLAQRMARAKPTLGVCFGAQLMAAALGANVFPGPMKEVGFHPLAFRGSAAAGPLRHLEGLPVLHWHGDTFDLPEGAELLASSERYAHQAFRVGSNILGLQFHAEMGLDERFDTWVQQWPHDVRTAGTTPERLRADYARHGPVLADAGRVMIGEWLAALC